MRTKDSILNTDTAIENLKNNLEIDDIIIEKMHNLFINRYYNFELINYIDENDILDDYVSMFMISLNLMKEASNELILLEKDVLADNIALSSVAQSDNEEVEKVDEYIKYVKAQNVTFDKRSDYEKIISRAYERQKIKQWLNEFRPMFKMIF